MVQTPRPQRDQCANDPQCQQRILGSYDGERDTAGRSTGQKTDVSAQMGHPGPPGDPGQVQRGALSDLHQRARHV